MGFKPQRVMSVDPADIPHPDLATLECEDAGHYPTTAIPAEAAGLLWGFVEVEGGDIAVSMVPFAPLSEGAGSAGFVPTLNDNGVFDSSFYGFTEAWPVVYSIVNTVSLVCPATLAELYKSTTENARKTMDLTGVTGVKLDASFAATTVGFTGKYAAQYSTDSGSTWLFFDGTASGTSIGSKQPQVTPVNSGNAISSRQNISGLGQVLVRLVQADGNGVETARLTGATLLLIRD